MIGSKATTKRISVSGACSISRDFLHKIRLLVPLLFLFAGWTPVTEASGLTLQQTIDLALKTDAELIRLQLAEASADEQSVAAGQLPDPVIKLGLLNLPSDTFALDQEPMTQFRIGLMQQFPAGNTLGIRSEQIYLNGQKNRIRRKDRQLTIRQEIQSLWLEITFWQQSQSILDEDRDLFDQLIEVTQSLYGVGRVNQQDVLRAELERSRLEDRMLNARLKEQEFRAKLGRWIGNEFIHLRFNSGADEWIAPSVERAETDLLSHPQIQLLDLEIAISGKSVQLARQAYKPNWGTEIGYGWRDGDNPDGSSRADFVSATVSVQLPLFTGNRQDRSSRAAQRSQEALRYQRQDLLRSLQAQVDIEFQREQQFHQRASLYQQKIIPKAEAQASASLNAYQAATSSFSDVVLAALQVQRIRLDLLKIQLQKRHAIARLQYLLPEKLADQPTAPVTYQMDKR